MQTSKAEPTQETELSVLKEILRWVKFSAMKEVRSILASALDDEQKRTTYQLSDGTKGIVEIGKLVGIKSTATIFKMWKQWAKIGLGEYIPAKGGNRFTRSFDLNDFGMEVNSQVPETEEGTNEQSEPISASPKLEEFQHPSGEGKE